VSRGAFYLSDELDDVIARMARQMHGLIDDPGNLVVVGILRRGAPLADRLCARLPLKADVAGLHLEVAPLQIADVHVPPYESEFEIHVNRREVTHVQES